MAFFRIFSRFRPAPSSLTSITMLPPLCWAESTSWPTGSLPDATRFGRLDAVVQAVAHQVRQRIDDALDQALVQFGGAAVGLQFDLLAHLAGDVAHQAREAAEHVVHRHHADGHHGFLQVARVALELLHAVEQAVMQHRIQRGRGLRQHGLGNDQLAHQVDDLVDFLHADADGSRFLVRVRGRRAAARAAWVMASAAAADSATAGAAGAGATAAGAGAWACACAANCSAACANCSTGPPAPARPAPPRGRCSAGRRRR